MADWIQQNFPDIYRIGMQVQKFRFSVLRISHGKSKRAKALPNLEEMLVVPWMAIPIVVIASNQLPIQNLKINLGGKLIYAVRPVSRLHRR